MQIKEESLGKCIPNDSYPQLFLPSADPLSLLVLATHPCFLLCCACCHYEIPYPFGYLDSIATISIGDIVPLQKEAIMRASFNDIK